MSVGGSVFAANTLWTAAWVGSGLAVMAGVGLIRRRRWVVAATRVSAAYAALYLSAVLADHVILQRGASAMFYYPSIASKAVVGLHWVAVPVVVWLVASRLPRDG